MEMSLWVQEGVSHPAPHVETLTMSRKERDRMRIMAGVKAKELSQVQAAELMGVGLPAGQARVAALPRRR